MITIEHTHNGPEGRGHGGTAAGRFAELVNPRAATVRLHAPVPLDTPMRSLESSTRASMYAGGDHIATIRPLSAPLDVGQVGRLPSLMVNNAESCWLDARDGVHMAPTCFACGHEREIGGLGLRPGPIAETGLHATSWTPAADDADPDGDDVEPWMVWAALDCPTGFAALSKLDASWAAVTGELSVEIRGPVIAGLEHQIISRHRTTSGRKIGTEAVMVGPLGVTVAVAVATWIAVPLTTVRPALAAA
ncbi:MAG: hypothetical protein ACR2P0_08050 [Acidimicrobiales bacterium]